MAIKYILNYPVYISRLDRPIRMVRVRMGFRVLESPLGSRLSSIDVKYINQKYIKVPTSYARTQHFAFAYIT